MGGSNAALISVWETFFLQIFFDSTHKTDGNERSASGLSGSFDFDSLLLISCGSGASTPHRAQSPNTRIILSGKVMVYD